jgi:hypothetical protein
LQIDCASFWQRNNRKFPAPLRSQIDRLPELDEASPSIVPSYRR